MQTNTQYRDDPRSSNPRHNAQPSATSPPVKIPAFTVSEIRVIEGSTNLKALATVKVGPLTIKKIRLICVPGQKEFATWPQESYESEGKRKWFQLIDAPREWSQPLSEAVAEAYANALREQQGTGSGGHDEFPA